MDWLRRNWPDVLIGVVFLAVVIAIIFTLLNGGFNLPFGGKKGGGTSTPPSLSTPLTPGGETVPNTATQTAGTPGVTVLPLDGTTPTTETEPSTSGEASTAPAAPSSTEAGASTEPSTPPAEPATSSTPPTESAQPTPPASTSAPATPVDRGASAASGEVSYRVSVGAFGTKSNAENLAKDVQAEGYPVFLAEQGSFTIVLVGPYRSETEARNIAQQLTSGPLRIVDPTVYRYEPDEAPTAASSSAPAEPATPPAAPSTPPAASSSPSGTTEAQPSGERTRYLQTGAFNTRESTLPQRATLESLGFVVSERQEDGFIKLLVGPFTPSEVESARTRLAGAGIESFPR